MTGGEINEHNAIGGVLAMVPAIIRLTDVLIFGAGLFLAAWRLTAPLSILLAAGLSWICVRSARWGRWPSVVLGALASLILVYGLTCVLVALKGISM